MLNPSFFLGRSRWASSESERRNSCATWRATTASKSLVGRRLKTSDPKPALNPLRPLESWKKEKEEEQKTPLKGFQEKDLEK